MTYSQQQNTTAPATKCDKLEREGSAWYTFDAIMKHGNLGCHGCGKYHAALQEGDNLQRALEEFAALPEKSDGSDVVEKSEESDVAEGEV